MNSEMFDFCSRMLELAGSPVIVEPCQELSAVPVGVISIPVSIRPYQLGLKQVYDLLQLWLTHLLNNTQQSQSNTAQRILGPTPTLNYATAHRETFKSSLLVTTS